MAERMGRPSEYTLEIGAVICERLSNGESLKSICDEPGMPARSTVCRWIEAYEAFRNSYARARERQCEHWLEEIFEIADDTSRDTFIDSEGKERTDHEHINRSRLRVDARKWAMSKLAPKKYGERVAAELSAPGGGPVQLQPVFPALPPAEVAAAVRALIAQAEVSAGLPAGNGSDAERVRALVTHHGGLLPPELYACLTAGQTAGGDDGS
jgi:hypothetical protein